MSNLIILGGGFAGVWAAMSAAAERKRLNDDSVKISLISRDPYLVLRPRLYEKISDDIRVPLMPLLLEIGVEFIQAEVSSITQDENRVTVADGHDFEFDRLILATGSELAPSNIPGEEFCFNVDTWDAAQTLDGHYHSLPENSTFVVIGASFTGLEIATELRQRFGETARIILIDRHENAGQPLGINPASHIEEALDVSKIERRYGTAIKSITADGIWLDDDEFIASSTIILATGLRASVLSGSIQGKKDEYGRLEVDAALKVVGSENVYAAGDAGYAYADDEHFTYLTCQHAIQLGRHAGHNAFCDLIHSAIIPYRQEVYRTCLDLGPWGALFTVGWDFNVHAVKAEGRAIKKQIVTELIYPPSPEIGADAIFKEISLVEPIVAAAE